MKAGPVIVGQLLQNRNRYCVPIYQRHYVWNKQKQWEPFWNDIRSKAIERLGGKERRFSHYMGAVVLEARGGFSARRVPSYQVVDGQQRLTTFQLFLAAARDYAASIGHKSAEETISTYLLNRDPHLMEEPEIEIFKVWPTQYDREMFMDILNLGGREALRKKYSEHFYKGKKRDQIYEYSTSPRLLVGYGYFYERIRHAVESDDLDDEFIETPEIDDEENESPISGNEIPRELRLDAIWQSLVEEFKVVEIVLEEGDDAQVIFETLNERGEPLLAADLVRNNIFQRADAAKEKADQLFEKHWKPFEDPFWSYMEKQGRYKKPRIEFFLSNYISGQIAGEVNLSTLFSEYKAFIKGREFASVAEELQEIGRYGAIYHELVGRSGETMLSRFSLRLFAWDVTTVFPLVMRIWAASDMSEDDKADCLQILLSYIIRRAICGLTTKNYNKSFLSMLNHLEKHGWSKDNLIGYLLTRKSDIDRFPRDDEFEQRWLSTPVYKTLNPMRVRQILEEIEVKKRGKFHETTTLAPNLTVEHVLPQTWKESWPLAGNVTPTADDYYQAVFYAGNEDDSTVGKIAKRNRLLQSFGNLTLLTQPLNGSVSNGAYEGKRTALNDHSLLVLNKEIIQKSAWDEDAIIERGKALFQFAKQIWQVPVEGAAKSEVA